MRAGHEEAGSQGPQPTRSWWLRLGEEPRAVPHARALRTLLRTAHLAAVGMLYGGHVYGVETDRLVPALIAAVATGGSLVALEVYQAPLWLAQLRGIATLAKILLVASIAILWNLRIPLLTLALVVGVVSSHMPGRWRYHSVLHGRVAGPREKG